MHQHLYLLFVAVFLPEQYCSFYPLAKNFKEKQLGLNFILFELVGSLAKRNNNKSQQKQNDSIIMMYILMCMRVLSSGTFVININFINVPFTPRGATYMKIAII